MGTVRMSVTGIFIDPKIVIVFFIIAGLSVYTVNAQTCPVEGHPPEKGAAGNFLGRCSSYNTAYACCNATDVGNLEDWLTTNQVEQTFSVSSKCLTQFNSLWCGGLCSPYQFDWISLGIISNATYNSTYGPIFTICPSFCNTLYSSCGSVPIVGTTTVSQIYAISTQFCQAVAPLGWNIRVSNVSGCYAGSDPFPTPEAPTSCPYGAALVTNPANTEGSFTILAADANGDRIYSGGADFQVCFSGPAWVKSSVTDNQDGTYTVNYFASQDGTYEANVTLNGISICNSPYAIVITSPLPNATDPSTTCPTGVGIALAGANYVSTFVILSMDDTGTIIATGGDSFTVNITGPHPVSVFGVQDFNNGTYVAYYNATGPGQYDVDVAYQGTPICDSPYDLTVLNGPVQFNVTNPTYSCPTNFEEFYIVDILNSFTIQTRDAFGNLIHYGGDIVQVWISGPSTVKHHVRDHHNGHYTVHFNVTMIGVYEVQIQVNGFAPSCSPMNFTAVRFILPRFQISPDFTCPFGKGLTYTRAGVHTTFTIQAKDIYFDVLTTGGADITASIDGPGFVPVTVTDENNGLYVVSYNATVKGPYVVSLFLGGISLCFSPYWLNVIPGPASLNSIVACPVSPVPATTLETLQIQGVDFFGQNDTIGGDKFMVLVAGPASDIVPIITDNSDGSYDAQFFVNTVGEYSALAYLNSLPLVGDPCSITVVPGAFSPSQSYVVTPLSGNSCDRAPAVFTIQTLDPVRNKLLVGGASFKFSNTGPVSLAFYVADNGDGTYTVTYSTAVAGTYVISISSLGVPLGGSPYTVNIGSGSIFAGKCSAAGAGLTGDHIVNVSTSFTVTAYDSCGNLVTDDQEVQVFITGADVSAIITPSIEFDGNGIYTVSYTPQIPGTYSIVVEATGSNVAPGPTTILAFASGAPGLPCGSCSEVFGVGSGLASSTAINGFFIKTEDCFGNGICLAVLLLIELAVTNASASFNIGFSYDGVAVPSELWGSSISDLQNGLYYVQYSAALTGMIEISVQLITGDGNEDVFGSPFAVDFIGASSCPNDCSSNGICNAGTCYCNPFFTSADCSQRTEASLLSAEFTPSGLGVILTFDQDTNRATTVESPVDCSTLMNIGGGSTCEWISDNEMLVELGASSAVPVNYLLALDVLRIPVLVGASEVYVNIPSQLDEPVVTIVGPTQLSNCESTLVLDASGSSGSGTFPWAFVQWSLVLTTSPNQVEEVIMSTLGGVQTPTLNLDATLLIPSVPYTFQLQLTNFLGATGTAMQTVVRSFGNTPAVVIQAPSTLVIRSDYEFSLRALATIPCHNGAVLNFAWSRREFGESSSVMLDLPSSVTSELFLPANTFATNSAFMLEVTVSLNSDTTILGSDEIIIIVEAPPTFARIDLGEAAPNSAITTVGTLVSRLSPIVLDSSASVYSPLQADQFYVTPFCSLGDIVNGCEFCLDQAAQETYFSAQTTVISLPPATFQPGLYTISMEVKDPNDVTEIALLYLDVVADKVPSVFVTTPLTGKINANDKLILNGYAVSLIGSTTLQYYWDVEPSYYLDLDQPDLFASRSNRNSPMLVLNPNVLFEGITYTFTLSVTDEMGTGKTAVQFTVNAAPSLGTSGISPPSGEPGSTFTLTSLNFQDEADDLPLSYNWGYVNGVGRLVPLFLQPSLRNTATVILPAGDWTVVSTTTDAYGASTSQSVAVSVQFGKRGNSDLLAAANQTLSVAIPTAIENGDFDGVIQLLFYALSDLNADTSNDTATATSLRNFIANFISSVDFNNQLGFGSTPNQIRSELYAALTENVDELSASGISTLTGQLQATLANVVANGYGTEDSVTEFTASALLSTISNLLQASSSLDFSDDQTLSASLISTIHQLTISLTHGRSVFDEVLDATDANGRILLFTWRQSVATLNLDYASPNISYIDLDSGFIAYLGESYDVVDTEVTFFQPPLDPFPIDTASNINGPVVSITFYPADDTNSSPAPIAFTNLPASSEVQVQFTLLKSWPYLACQAWDEASSQWSTKGCAVQSITVSSAVCLCDHLSTYAITNLPAPVAPGMVAQLPAEPRVSKFSVQWWLIFIVIGAIILALIIMFNIQKRYKRRKPLEEEEEEVSEAVVAAPKTKQALRYVEDNDVTVNYKIDSPRSVSDQSITLTRHVIEKMAEDEEPFYAVPKSKTKEESTPKAEKKATPALKPAAATKKEVEPEKDQSSSEEEDGMLSRTKLKEDSDSEGEEGVLRKTEKKSMKEESSSEEERQQKVLKQ